MRIDVEFISRELIKPSSPTPDHLRHYSLSFLDQIGFPTFVNSIFFYPKQSNMNKAAICNLFKQSLSQVLTIFYPLAGRIKNNSYVDCNDEGFLFVEANANCQLSIVLRDRNPYNNNKFIPDPPEDANYLAGFCQITFFNCGGLAISIAFSHKLGDGFSMIMFLDSWAAISRGNTDISIPSFGLATLFPTCNIPGFKPTTWFSKEKIITKVFGFDASTIEALVAKYAIGGGRVSRVEALAAFIWSRFMATTQLGDQEAKHKLYTVNQVVNLRPRVLKQPLQKLSFGNLVWFAAAEADMEAKDDDDSYGIVKRMKDSLRKLNSDYIQKLQNSDEQLNFIKKIADAFAKEEVVSFTFSSVCNFPLYETDFGWGKPVWVGYLPHLAKNTVVLIDTKEGQGIEAWVCLTEEDMSKFEIDNLFLAHVSSTSNGNPLHAPSRL